MESRKRLRPWLWTMVNREQFGLKWVDRGQEIFSIPWVHRANKSWDDSYCQIFKEWAKFTKRHKDGEPDDWPGWKTRLRTALTKLPDFEELKHLHKVEGEKPYRVYRFVPEREVKAKVKYDSSSSAATNSPSSSQEVDFSPGSAEASSPHQANDACLNLDVTTPIPNEVRQTFGNIPTVVESDDIEDYDCIIPNNIPVDQTVNVNNDYQLPSINDNEVKFPSDLMNIDSGELVTAGDKLPSGELRKYQMTPSNPPSSTNPPGSTNPCSSTHCLPVPKPTISYKIYYLNEVVKEGLLYDEGVHFYFGNLSADSNLPDKVVGPKHLEQIQLPDINQLNRSLQREQQQLLQKILLTMGRGFLLQCHKRDIYIQRLCQARIYVSSDFVDKNTPLERSSKKPFKLFNFERFKERSMLSVPYSPMAILTFAQELQMESMSKLLVYMELTSMDAKELAPPSSKPSLLFSDLNSEDQMLEQVNAMSLQD